MTLNIIQKKILRLKEEKEAAILAHYYQPIEIQKVADYLGDSLELSRIAKEKVPNDIIIFAGVRFMAETASILNQDKRVLISHPESLCPMAAYLDAGMVKSYREKYPNSQVITYVNSTAAVKAESDLCCTSSNAVKIVKRAFEKEKSKIILFGPDANLADFVEQETKINLIKMPENGNCVVHSQVTKEDLLRVKQEHPDAMILVHPECVRAVRELADIVGSTAQMYKFVKESPKSVKEFIIGTEIGLLERMMEDIPEKKYYLASDKLVCYNMKKHTIEMLEHVLNNLDDNNYEVKVPKNIAKRAIVPLERMLEYS
ncbi:MAG: quinolinate synthase NadA [Candidatus Lokiarchaeota archaeon]|nr:quinolinate synthase NadA [Candidatus Lokiarchaeota archaeon]